MDTDLQTKKSTIKKCLFIFPNNTTIQILYNDFYAILLYVLAAYFSHHQVGILVHKKSKEGDSYQIVAEIDGRIKINIQDLHNCVVLKDK